MFICISTSDNEKSICKFGYLHSAYVFVYIKYILSNTNRFHTLSTVLHMLRPVHANRINYTSSAYPTLSVFMMQSLACKIHSHIIQNISEHIQPNTVSEALHTHVYTRQPDTKT